MFMFARHTHAKVNKGLEFQIGSQYSKMLWTFFRYVNLDIYIEAVSREDYEAMDHLNGNNKFWDTIKVDLDKRGISGITAIAVRQAKNRNAFIYSADACWNPSYSF